MKYGSGGINSYYCNMMKQPEQRFSFYSSGAPGKNLCIIYCIQGPISLQHRAVHALRN